MKTRKKAKKKKSLSRQSAINAARSLQRLLKNPHVRRMQDMIDMLTEERDTLRTELRMFLEPTWRDGEGNIKPMSSLDDGHLRNCIAYCSRKLLHILGNARWVKQSHSYSRSLGQLLEEAHRRGIEV